MSVKYSKTNALRRLDTMRVPYTVFSYDGKDGAIDGKSVCKKIGQDAKHFYKTLVTVGRDKEVYVFVIPILEELDQTCKNKPINIEINPKSFKNDSEISILTNQLSQIEQKEERIKIAYENGVDSLEEYKENKIRLLNDKKILLSKIEEVKKDKDVNIVRNKIFKKCESAYDTFRDNEISDFDKSIIAHELFDKIVFVKNEHKLIIYYK